MTCLAGGAEPDMEKQTERDEFRVPLSHTEARTAGILTVRIGPRSYLR